MRFVRFSRGEGTRLGMYTADGRIVDVAAAASHLGTAGSTPSSIVALIEAPDGSESAKALADAIGTGAQAAWSWAESELSLHHPYRPRKNVIRAGGNIVRPESSEEASVTLPPGRWLGGRPIAYYTKAPTAAVDPDSEISWPTNGVTKVYAEPQLAVIVGRTISYADEAAAQESVFGYAVATDVTSQGLKDRHGQWVKAASLDTFFPWGPVIVTADEVTQPGALSISLSLNGETKIKTTTAEALYSVGEVLSELSHGIRLEPGDVVLLGVPDCVGFGAEPPRWLHDGDTITSTIDGVGTITNVVSLT